MLKVCPVYLGGYPARVYLPGEGLLKGVEPLGKFLRQLPVICVVYHADNVVLGVYSLHEGGGVRCAGKPLLYEQLQVVGVPLEYEQIRLLRAEGNFVYEGVGVGKLLCDHPVPVGKLRVGNPAVAYVPQCPHHLGGAGLGHSRHAFGLYHVLFVHPYAGNCVNRAFLWHTGPPLLEQHAGRFAFAPFTEVTEHGLKGAVRLVSAAQ